MCLSSQCARRFPLSLIPVHGSCAVPSLFPRVRTTLEKKIPLFGEKRHTTAGGVHLGARLHNTQLDLNGEVPLELSEVALARRAILTVRAEPNLGPL